MSNDVCFCFFFFFLIFFPLVIICFSSCLLNLCILCIIFGIPIAALSLMIVHGSDDIFLNVSLTDIIVCVVIVLIGVGAVFVCVGLFMYALYCCSFCFCIIMWFGIAWEWSLDVGSVEGFYNFSIVVVLYFSHGLFKLLVDFISAIFVGFVFAW